MNTKTILLAALVVAAVSIGVGWTQSGIGTPAFEAAVVKANDSGDTRGQGSRLRGGQLTWRNLPIKMILNYAFAGGVTRFDQFEGGPDWLETARFDVIAKSANDTSPQEVQLMLQNLLIDRLKLQFHRELRVRSVYALKAGKQLKLRKTSGGSPAGCGTVDGVQGQNHRDCINVTMAALADDLPQMALMYFDRPVLDATGLKDVYDFKLDWVGRRFPTTQPNGAADPAGAVPVDPESGPTLFDALQKLGLKLEEQKLPISTIVIDHLDRVPSEN
ncbi:MAG TPA: TIGR03435 family protein [Terriglobia bacterium]|jgi:uncharacterized protein (TIGR03435 family)